MRDRLARLAALVAVGVLLACPAMAAETEAEASRPVAGGVELVSKYVQRGMTLQPDNDGLAVQPFVDAELPWGFFLGYWGSNVGATVAQPMPDAFENDLSAGWSLDLSEAELRLGATYYLVFGGADSNVAESFADVIAYPHVAGTDMGKLAFSLRTMLDDSDWSHAGDTYLLIRHELGPYHGWTFGTDLGWQGAQHGRRVETTERFAFRHLDLTVVYEWADTGLRLRATGTLGGRDRAGSVQPNAIVWGAGWGF